MNLDEKINKSISSYYSEKVNTYGTNPQGVDWNGEEGQIIRFEQLTKVIEENNNFSITDLGCGYGALYNWLSINYASFIYQGYDISKDMINAALKESYSNNANFYCESQPNQLADYCIASGIFNVRLSYSDNDWLTYIKNTITILNTYSKRGFSFNCLTSYSDEDKKRDYLYYTDPLEIFDYCKRNFSKQVALLHDYGLYEFTIIVRKEYV